MTDDLTATVLPYAGTSGWSGSQTSRDRAKHDDESGRTQNRQMTALRELRFAGPYGMTSAELGAQTGWHHGQSSGVLSVLHKENIIARLSQTRDGRKVYTRHDFVDGRATERHGRHTRTCPHCGGDVD